jgi:spermidine/putrescine transport system permease protein
MKAKPRFASIVFVSVIALLYAPLIVLVVNSFNAARYGGRWDGLTLNWYRRLLADRATMDALLTSLSIGAVATIVATLLGTLAAWMIHRHRTRLQRAHHLISELPLAVPDIWIGVAMQMFFVSVGWRLGWSTMLVAHITFCLCYVTALMLGRLQHFDLTTMEAAADLGATRWQIIWQVVVPLLLPGMIAAALLCFLLSMDDFIITFFVSGAGSATLPVRLYSLASKSRDLPVVNALSTILIAVTLLLTWIGQRWIKAPPTS